MDGSERASVYGKRRTLAVGAVTDSGLRPPAQSVTLAASALLYKHPAEMQCNIITRPDQEGGPKAARWRGLRRPRVP